MYIMLIYKKTVLHLVVGLLVYVLMTACAGICENKIKMYEKDYVNHYCEGITEYVLPDKTRVDCLTDDYAIEFDYAKKWAESIGQSLYYASKTGKKPAVAIILTNPSDTKYIERIQEADKNIKIFKIYAVDYGYVQ